MASAYDYDYDDVVEAVVKCGSNQWNLIGTKLGMHSAAMESLADGKPSKEGKLQAIISNMEMAIGKLSLKKKLLDVCSRLPEPILGGVEDYLRNKKRSGSDSHETESEVKRKKGKKWKQRMGSDSHETESEVKRKKRKQRMGSDSDETECKKRKEDKEQETRIGDASSKLDVLIVTATDTEFKGVEETLRKLSGKPLQKHPIKYSKGELPCKAFLWESSDSEERKPMMIGVTQLTETGSDATVNMIAALKDAIKFQEVTNEGFVAMVGMCAGDEDKVALGDVLVPWEVAMERGKIREDGTFALNTKDYTLPSRLKTDVQLALPKNQDDDKRNKWLEYVPDKVKAPSPRYLVDATLCELKKRSRRTNDGDAHTSIATLRTDLVDHYKWSEKIISKEVVIEVLENLVSSGYVDETDKNGVNFKITSKGKKRIRTLTARCDAFPRSDSSSPDIKHDSVITGHVVNTAMTKKAWDEARKRTGKNKAIGYEMEGFTFYDQVSTWCESVTPLFIKVVADFATEEYKMKNKYYQVYASAVATAFLIQFLEIVAARARVIV